MEPRSGVVAECCEPEGVRIEVPDLKLDWPLWTYYHGNALSVTIRVPPGHPLHNATPTPDNRYLKELRDGEAPAARRRARKPPNRQELSAELLEKAFGGREWEAKRAGEGDEPVWVRLALKGRVSLSKMSVF